MTTTGTRPGWATLLSRPSTTSVLLFVVAVTAALSFAPDFATRANISSMLGDMLAPAIVLLAASLAMTGGVADLSVGAEAGQRDPPALSAAATFHPESLPRSL